MGYYIIQHDPPPTAQQIGMAAVMAFQQFHVLEKKPVVEIDSTNKLVRVCAGETMVFTWAELGFQ